MNRNDRHERRRSTVSKDLDELDETDAHGHGHYSAAEIAESCHAAAGQTHAPDETATDDEVVLDAGGEGRP